MQGKYKTFEGTEISIENCLKAKVKDLVVEGKTCQNLVSNLDELVGKVYTRDTVAIIDSTLFKANTTYTAMVAISESSYSSEKYGAIFSVFYPTLTNGYRDISLKDGTFKLTFSTKGEIPSKIQLGVQYGNSNTSSFKLDNLVILEGDYTNTDLPTSIDGIESVTEREENVLSVKINDNTTTLNLPIPLRSLQNGVADTIEGNKLVQRVGKVVLDGSEDWKLQSCNVKGNGILNIFFIIQDLIIKLKEKQFIICDKYIQQKTPIADTTNEGVLVNEEKRLYLRLFTSKATTVEKAKEYIKGNPFVVYYELAEPIIHDLRIPPIQTVKGTNIITTDNNIKPKLSMKVKVKKIMYGKITEAGVFLSATEKLDETFKPVIKELPQNAFNVEFKDRADRGDYIAEIWIDKTIADNNTNERLSALEERQSKSEEKQSVTDGAIEELASLMSEVVSNG